MKNTVKQKIIFGIFIWVFISLVMFLFVFKKIGNSNKNKFENIQNLKKEKSLLEIERDSFLQGKEDMEKIEKEKIKPDNFFSQDITLVNEIRRLEQIGRDLDLDLNLSGVSGTTKTAKKADTKSDIVQIPVALNVRGSLPNLAKFLEYLENLEFLTSVSYANLSATDPGIVALSLNASFYVKK